MNKIEIFLKVFQKFEKLVKEASGSTDSTRFLDSVRKLASTNSFIAVNFEFIANNLSIYGFKSLFEKAVSQIEILVLFSLYQALPSPIESGFSASDYKLGI